VPNRHSQLLPVFWLFSEGACDAAKPMLQFEADAAIRSLYCRAKAFYCCDLVNKNMLICVYGEDKKII
jgi:hypothetical protein